MNLVGKCILVPHKRPDFRQFIAYPQMKVGY